VNLLDQIDDRLKDPDFSLNHDDFEDCSTSLLTDIYPNLVPISGGSDDGRDAEIGDPDGTIGVLITSARDLRGVLANLRKGCRQMTKKQLPIKRVILANLAELNASKRRRLDEAAEALGFKVVQTYPRPWYANRLRRDPDWRVKLLRLRGGTYTLARPPLDDLGVDLDATVGRSVELRTIRDAAGDVLVSGVPGVGKTHLVAQVTDALFVEKLADLSHLADDLLETDPKVVVLDDAGARPEGVVELQTIRRSHQLSYRIIAVCWPHETQMVADRLKDAAPVEVGRMTKAELGEILRKRGITRDSVLRRILDQADGRPAWAVRLGDLLKAGGQWNDVLRGHSVRAEVGHYLRTSRISDHAYQTLATIALLGGISDTEFRTLANLQGDTVLNLNATLRKVAESGLLDVEQVTAHGEDRKVTYTVQPDLLAASLVADAYFSKHPAPHLLAELREGFPGRGFHIVKNTILAELVGATDPSRPTQEQLLTALGSDLAEPQENLLRYYAALGANEANFALNLVRERLRAALAIGTEEKVSSNYKSIASVRGKLLAELAASNVSRIGFAASLEHLKAGACLLLDAGEDIDTFVNEYFIHVRSSDIGEAVDPAHLVALAEHIAAMSAENPHERRVLLEVGARSLAPAWEASYMVPDQPRNFRLKSFLLHANDMGTITNAILDRLATIADGIDAEGFVPLAKVLDTWVRAAVGYALPFGLRVTPEQCEAAKPVARRFATILATTPLTSGTRRRLNGICKPLKLRWPDPDPLFTALAPLEDDADDEDDEDGSDDRFQLYLARREARAKADRARLVEALTPYLEQPPEILCERLADLQPDLRAADVTVNNQTRNVFEHLATTNVDPPGWIRAALDHGMGWQMLPLVQKTLKMDGLPDDLLARLLANPQTRSGVIGLAMEYGTGRGLEAVVAAMNSSDFGPNIWTAFVRVTPQALKLLESHPDRLVAALAVTCWAGWYDYAKQHKGEESNQTEAQLAALTGWTDTMLDLEVPNQLEEYALERGLVSLARTSPDNFKHLFIRHVNKEKYPHNDFDEWASAAQTLDHDHKTAVWHQLKDHPCKREVFWVLAGKDTMWIGDRLEDGSVTDPSELLGRVGFGQSKRPPIEEIAALFANRAAPELILASLPDTLSGDDVEVAQYRLDESQKLAESDNADVRAVGEAGVRLFTSALEAAKKKAREHELRGEIWY
jgi:hypothetical protein